eukprot:6979692-Pyramimonas_sp.AAC.1
MLRTRMRSRLRRGGDDGCGEMPRIEGYSKNFTEAWSTHSVWANDVARGGAAIAAVPKAGV